jgi:unsaturated rhamnogalacturonyl hydrolase
MDMDRIDNALARLATGFRRLKGIGAADAAEDGEFRFDAWDWEVGVGLYGLFRDAEHRCDAAAMAAIGRWYDREIAR